MRLEIESITAVPPIADNVATNSQAENNAAQAQEFLRNGIRAAQSGNRAEARTALLRATELDPKCENAWLWLASISEYPEELLVFLNNVLQISPENARALEWRAATNALLARTLIQRGADAVEEGQNEKASEYFSKSLEYDQQNANAWMWLASLADSSEGKLNYLDNALAIEPDNEKALVAYREAKHELTAKHLADAKAAAVAGRTADAHELLNAVLEEMPDSEDAWMLRSHFADNFEDKIRSFERVLDINPGNAAAAASLASLRSLVGEPVAETNEEDPADVKAEVAAETDEAVEDIVESAVEEPVNAEIEELTVQAEETVALEMPELLSANEEHSVETADEEVEQSDDAGEMNVGFTDAQQTSEPEPFAEVVAEEAHQWAAEKAAFTEPVNFEEGSVADEDFVTEEFAAEDAVPETELQADTEENFTETAFADSVQETSETDSEYGEEFEYKMTVDPFADTADSGFENTDEVHLEVSDETMAQENVGPEENAESIVFEEVKDLDDDFGSEISLGSEMPDTEASMEMVEGSAGEVSMPSDGLFGFDGAANEDPYKTVYSLPSVDTIFEEANLRFDEMNGIKPNVEEVARETPTHFFGDENKTPAVDPFTAEAPQTADAIPMPEAEFVTEGSASVSNDQDAYKTTVVTEMPATAACVFCGHGNEPFAVSCSSCMAVLTLSDLELLLANTNANRVEVRAAVEALELERAESGLSEDKLMTLGIGHLNLSNLEAGHSVLAEAARLKPNDVFLAGLVNTLHIRVNEIRSHQKMQDEQVSGKKILVVDDSPTIRKLISGKLEKSGHDVFCSSDGIEAMETLRGMVPDLILLDITMPRMDGYQVCKLIRSNELTKDVPVVMISGKDGFFDKVRGRMAGSSGYITKPFGPETLMKVVDGFLKNGNGAMAEL